MIRFEVHFYTGWGKGLISFFCTWKSSYSCTIHWRDDFFFSYWVVLVSKSIGHSCMVYFWILSSISLEYLSILRPIPPDFDQCSFALDLKLGTMESTNFALFQECFGYLDIFQSQMNLKIGFSILQEKPLDFWLGLCGRCVSLW